MMKSPGVFFSEKILDTFELIAQYLGQESIVWFYNRQLYEWLWWQRVEDSFEKILDGFELYSAVFKPRISCLICQLISNWIIFGTKIWPKICKKILDTFEPVVDRWWLWCTQKKRKHSRWPRFVRSDWKGGKNNLSIIFSRKRKPHVTLPGKNAVSAELLSPKVISHKTSWKFAIKLNENLHSSQS